MALGLSVWRRGHGPACEAGERAVEAEARVNAGMRRASREGRRGPARLRCRGQQWRRAALARRRWLRELDGAVEPQVNGAQGRSLAAGLGELGGSFLWHVQRERDVRESVREGRETGEERSGTRPVLDVVADGGVAGGRGLRVGRRLRQKSSPARARGQV